MVAVAGRLGDPRGFAAGAGRDRTFTAGGGQPRPTHAAPQTTQRMTRGPEATTGCGRASGRSITSRKSQEYFPAVLRVAVHTKPYCHLWQNWGCENTEC